MWYTSKVSADQGKVVYGVILSWPRSGVLEVSSPEAGPHTSVSLLGWAGPPLEFSVKEGVMMVDLPDLTNSPLAWGWTLKFLHLANGGNSL